MTDTTTDTTTDTADQTDATTTTTDTDAATDTTDWAAEAAKWKDLARKHEDRSKANATAAKELEELKKKAMTDQERAVAEAKAAGRAEALAETGGKLVTAEIRAVASGRLDDDQLVALLENVNVANFLTGDGDVDADKVAKFVDGIAPKDDADTATTTTTNAQRPPDLGQGARGSSVALNGDPLLRDLKSKLGIR